MPGRDEQPAAVGARQGTAGHQGPQQDQCHHQYRTQASEEGRGQGLAQAQGSQRIDPQGKGEPPPAQVERHALAGIASGDQQRERQPPEPQPPEQHGAQ
ncbi:hypothetical protein Q3H58_002523 [Pseudomonas psychrotolerans]|nr:hypothetical protein [Pseudomonas psychrotolerans]